VRREYAREQERADARLADAMRPYTRFTELETQRLADAETRAADLRARLAELSEDVTRVTSSPNG
jgi:hypothetical protein